MEEQLVLLREECSSEEYKSSVKLLFTYVKNIHNNNTVEKYRKLRTGNEKFNANIWKYEACRTMLLLAGFEQQDEFIVLPKRIDVNHLYTTLNDVLAEIEPSALSTASQKSAQNTTASTIQTGSLNLMGAKGGSLFEEDVKADLTLLSYLMEMGYSKVAAERGLIATGNKGVQPAMDWIDAHPGCHTKPSSTKVSTTHDTNDASLMGIMESSSAEIVTSRLQKSLDEKHKYQEKLRLQEIKKARLDKAEDKKAREYLKKNIESERTLSKEKFEREKHVRHAEIEANTHTTDHPVLSSSSGASSNICRIRIKNIDGTHVTWEGDKNTSVKDFYSYVKTLVKTDDEYQAAVPHPHVILEPNDETSLLEKGLHPTSTIVIQKLNQNQAATFINRLMNESSSDVLTTRNDVEDAVEGMS